MVVMVVVCGRGCCWCRVWGGVSRFVVCVTWCWLGVAGLCLVFSVGFRRVPDCLLGVARRLFVVARCLLGVAGCCWVLAGGCWVLARSC